MNAFVDLVEEEEKKQDILISWKSFEIEVMFIGFFCFYYLLELIIDLMLATTTIP